MIKIFAKLRLIITITILLITILFSFLAYTQYTQYEESVENFNTDLVNSLDRDLQMIQDFYSKLATSYYEESLHNNLKLIDMVMAYDNSLEFPPYFQKDDYDAILEPIFLNARNNDFSYIRLYDSNNNIQYTYSTDETVNEIGITYTYPLYDLNTIVGYVELGLPIDSIIATLDQTTNQSTYALFNKSTFEKQFVDFPDQYTSSSINNDYFISHTNMKKFYNYTNLYEIEAYNSIISTIKSITYEPLTKNSNFYLTRKYSNQFYTFLFITLDETSELNEGYYVLFQTNETLNSYNENFKTNILLFIGLYITLLFIIGFIYYVLHYLYNFSYTDNLTKAYNRHKFFEVIQHNIYDFHRYNYLFSVILIDIDNFKAINDTLGHNTGDHVLVDFVNVLEDSLRTTDYLFRWGGEEFLILLSHCDGKIAYQVAEKLRSNIEAHDFALKNSLPVTASFGVSAFKDTANIESMISQADKALYESKNTGKNRSTLYGHKKVVTL